MQYYRLGRNEFAQFEVSVCVKRPFWSCLQGQSRPCPDLTLFMENPEGVKVYQPGVENAGNSWKNSSGTEYD